MAIKKPIPKTQRELSQATVTPYAVEQYVSTKIGINDKSNRGTHRSVKNDNVKPLTVGLRDIDETIVYYFNNVIKPTVTQNGLQKSVPVLYSSPERWASVQKDGYYRDKNGKAQMPLIMFKRESVEKNRGLGNKLDANTPINYGIFKKNYSKKNAYDRFSILGNRIPVEEYYGVVIPDYVNITYSCMVFTEYIDHMNSLVESINYASDSYWGDPERFQFRAMIDNYTTSTELIQGQDRTVKTQFTIKMLGHIIPSTVNAQVKGISKFYTKSAVKFGLEVAGTEEILNVAAKTAASEASSRFYDQSGGTTTINNTYAGMSQDQKDYLALVNTLDTNTDVYTLTTTTVTFTNQTIATPPSGFPALEIQDFTVTINGLYVEQTAIDSISQVGSDVQIVFNSGLGYELVDGMEITATGKFED